MSICRGVSVTSHPLETQRAVAPRRKAELRRERFPEGVGMRPFPRACWLEVVAESLWNRDTLIYGSLPPHVKDFSVLERIFFGSVRCALFQRRSGRGRRGDDIRSRRWGL